MSGSGGLSRSFCSSRFFGCFFRGLFFVLLLQFCKVGVSVLYEGSDHVFFVKTVNKDICVAREIRLAVGRDV